MRKHYREPREHILTVNGQPHEQTGPGKGVLPAPIPVLYSCVDGTESGSRWRDSAQRTAPPQHRSTTPAVPFLSFPRPLFAPPADPACSRPACGRAGERRIPSLSLDSTILCPRQDPRFVPFPRFIVSLFPLLIVSVRMPAPLHARLCMHASIFSSFHARMHPCI